MNEDLLELLADPNLLPTEREALERLLRPTAKEHVSTTSDAPSEATGSGTGIVEVDHGPAR